MPGNARFIASQPVKAWLSQFATADQGDVVEVLRKLRLVSRDAFAEKLQAMLFRAVSESPGPVAFYVERELPKDEQKKTLPLFEQSAVAPRRAIGSGPEPVRSSDPESHDTGSEGVVAQLVSEVCRRFPAKAFNQPGPDTLRNAGVHQFILVTDCIGSGKRASDYLSAAWGVASVRSWWSNRHKYGLSFTVISYAATAAGQKLVRAHPCQPGVFFAAPCPTVRDSFSRHRVEDIVELCRRYDPTCRRGRPPNTKRSLGFGGMGVMIAFAHGMPNNSPTMLWRSEGGWLPLFEERVTAGVRQAFSDERLVPLVRDRLQLMRQSRLAEAMNDLDLVGEPAPLLLTLAASGRTPGNVSAIAHLTGLTLDEVTKAAEEARSYGWLNAAGRLTDTGKTQLMALRSSPPAATLVQSGANEAYYPTTLREPVPSV